MRILHNENNYLYLLIVVDLIGQGLRVNGPIWRVALMSYFLLRDASTAHFLIESSLNM
jgi:hypothetical protein